MSPAPAKMNPFPGLRPFTQEEDYLFFGREEQTLELLQRLGSNRFVAVVGTSGSGKSSLVRCGLFSELLGGRMLEAGASWEIAVTHPGGNPLALLTGALLDAGLYDREEEHASENLLATLSRSHFGLVEAVKQANLGEKTNFLLVVDQFEEIFRFHEAGQSQQEAANEFVSLLLEATAQKDVPIYVMLTMRSDFIGECGQFEGLAEMVNRGEFLIPRLNREQFKRVIEGPIKVAGGQIAPRLLQRLLNDLGQQADQLPCLQHALMRTWNVWAAKGDAEALDLDDYQRVGKMSQALSLHADEIYESLASDRQRELCQGMFQALTVEESNNRGIRRPQRMGRLRQILEVAAGELLPIIDAYRQSGVTFLMPSPEVELTDQTIIDISHESLMRVWTRLRQWVEDETQAAGIYHRLSESAALHERGKAGLYRDPELGIALAWRESKRPNAAWAERYRPGFATAMGFLEASQQASVAEAQAREAARQRELEQAQQLAEAQQLRLEQQHRAARKLRKLVAGVAVVAVIAGIACVAALMARNEAGKLAQIAAAEAENARNNAERAEQSQQETEKALTEVESQKAEAERNLTKAKEAEQIAHAAEEAGRKLLYTTDMRLAPFVWADDRTTAQQLRTLLASHNPDNKISGNNAVLPTGKKPDLRGFEWHYYQHLLNSSAAVFLGHETSVIASGFTSDGQLVTLDQNAQVRRWNLESQNEDEAGRRDLTGGPSAQFRILSPDGRLAALAEGNKVHVFDTSTGKEHFEIASAQGPTRRLIFTPDSTRLVIVDDKIRWCNAASGAVIASFDQRFTRVSSLALSADGLRLAVVGHGPSGRQYSIFRLDPATQRVALQGNGNSGGTVSVAALSPDGRLIAVNYPADGRVRVADAATGRLIAQHDSAHASPVSAMIFPGGGSKLVTADVEGTIKIWEDARKLTSKSVASMTLKGHEAAITHVGFSSAGEQLVSTSADKTARVWDMDHAGAAVRVLERAGIGCHVARFSLDGSLIAAADGNSVRLWDAATGHVVRLLSAGDKGRVHSVAFSPTDNRLLAVGYGGQADVSHVVLWDIDAGTELARLPGATDLTDFRLDDRSRTGVVGALAFSPDGKYLVAGFGSPTTFFPTSSPTPLKVWEVATHRLIRRLSGHTGSCPSLDFSRDGKLLASGSHDGTAMLWSTESWKAMRTLRNPDPGWQFSQAGMEVAGVAFAPDGKTLAVASRGGTVQFWDATTGKLRETLKGHSNAVHAVVFSPDGRTLASGSTDQTVRLWNVETQRELMQLGSGSVELGGVETLAFSPDGTHLLAGGDGTAFWSTASPLWNDPDQAAEKLRLLLNSNADFQSRIRMLSENVRLHGALAKLNSNDVRLQAALAAAQANWHASHQAWPEASAAFDRLIAAEPAAPEAWLRTPGLLRLATALLHQDRPRDAAALLTGGAKRRTADGLLAAANQVALGMVYAAVDGQVRVTELRPRSPAARSALLTGDVILKVNDTELTQESLSKLSPILAGEAGTKVRLTVRHSGSEQPEVIELTPEEFVNDTATGEQLHSLRTAINERLAQEPRHPGLLELRAELAGQWSDAKAQLGDYTAAIEALSQQNPEPTADLQRLYGRRGNAHVALRQGQQAVDDYARIVTDQTTDDALLSNQALALANFMLQRGPSTAWTVLEPVDLNAAGGATLTRLEDNSILVNGPNPAKDVYTLAFRDLPKPIRGLRLEVLTHESLPQNGPGRFGLHGGFNLTTIKAQLDPPTNVGEARSLKLARALADYSQATADTDGRVQGAIDANDNTGWAIYPECGKPHVALFELAEPITETDGLSLRVTLEFKSGYPGHCLGRFRLSAFDDSAAFEREKILFAEMKISDPWTNLAEVHQFRGDQQAIDQLVERRPKLAGQIGDLFIKEQDKDWLRAVAIYSRGITAETTDVVLLSKRARAYEALQNWDAAAADWTRAATGNPEGAKLLAEFAQRLAAGGQVSLASGQFDNAQALYERSLEADPENDVVATELAQLLLNKNDNGNSARWTVLQPTEMKSEGGATLTLQPDASILASGTNPDRDAYSLFAKTDLEQITAIRLEALPDPSLPINGPGRAPDGNFHLNELRVFSRGQPSSLTDIIVDHDLQGGARNVIDGKLDATDGWNNFYWAGKTNTAIIATRVDRAPDDDLKIELYFSRRVTTCNLGRFRLSVSADPAVPEWIQQRLAFQKVTDPWLKLAAAYAVSGRHEEASQYFGRALQWADGYEARKPILELAARFDKVLSTLVQRQPDDSQLQLALARNLTAVGQTALAAEKGADALAPLKQAQDIFTRLRAEPQWTVLTPLEMQTETGAKLELQQDGCIFVHQPTKNETHSLVFQTELKGIKGLRLETLADPRLPAGGPGWHTDGSFILSELSLHAASANSPDQPKSIALRNASADFSQVSGNGWHVRGAVDGNDATGWAIHPEINNDHTAVFDLAEEVGDGQSIRLTVRLKHDNRPDKILLGRFRLSFTNDPKTLPATRIRLDLKDSELVDFYLSLAKAYAASDRASDATQVIAQALQQAPNTTARAGLIEQAISHDLLRAGLLGVRPDDPQLQLGYAKWLAARGRWDEAAASYQHAARLDAKATPPWLQTGFWKVGLYPYGLEQAFPPESNPNPLQPVAAAAVTGQPTPAALSWQPVTPAGNRRIDFGTERGCNYLLTRIFSPVEQEIAFQMGDDDRLRLFLNDRSLFQSSANAGAAQPKEHELAVTLQTGWNTVLVKVENNSGSCAVFLTLSLDPQDLAAARVGSRLYQAKQLTSSGKADEAIAQLTELIAESPKDVRIFAARAEAYGKLSQWEPALADWASADLYAPDKKVRYGTPAFYCLEQRAHIFNRLKQHDRQALEYTELLKPERIGENAWMYSGRAGAYDRLRKWDQARADYDQAIQASSVADRGSFHFYRARHLAAQGLWKQAADDVKLAYQNPADRIKDWTSWRDAALIDAIAGNVEGYRKAAAELYGKSAGNPNADQCKWTVLTMLLYPEMATRENGARLLEMAGKSDTYSRPRLTAAAYFRAGEYQKAAELYSANTGGTAALFLRAMTEHQLGNKDLAKKLLEEGNAWIRSQQAKDPGAGVPQATSWQDWIAAALLQQEAADLVLGEAVGPPRKLALAGQADRAANAYAKLLADAADQDAKSRIVDELAQFDDVVTTLYQRLPNDPSIGEVYRRMVQRLAADYHQQLAALNGQTDDNPVARSKLVVAILGRDGVLESLLKLRPEDAQLAALHAVRIGDWNNAAAAYSKLTEQNPKADSVAWMVPPTLWAYAGKLQRHRELCQKMYDRYRDSTGANDAGRYLKVLLLAENRVELPQEVVKKFYDSADSYGVWYLSTLAFLQCRQGDYAEAHKQLDQALAQEAKSPSAGIKAMALAIRALTYAKQQDKPQARKSLDDLKQFMASDLKVKWNANGLVDGSTILNGVTLDHNKLIPEIVRREAEQLLQSTAAPRPNN